MALGDYVLDNNVRTTLVGAHSNSTTAIKVAAAASPWKNVPSPAGGLSVLTILDSLSNPTKIETISYTTRTLNGIEFDLTGVTRGVFGTTAQSWSGGEIVIQSATAEMLMGRMALAILADVAGCAIVGRSANTTGVLAAITATSNDAVLRRRSNVLGFGSIINADIDAAAAIALSKLESLAAQSVIGRQGTSGAPVALTAAELQVLGRAVGGNLGFLTINGQFLRQAPLETSATAITLDDATHHGRTIVCTASSAVTITCPATVSSFFQCSVIQHGTGRITFTASGSGVAVNNLHGHSKTAAQYAQVLLSVATTTGGNKFLLQGETGT